MANPLGAGSSEATLLLSVRVEGTDHELQWLPHRPYIGISRTLVSNTQAEVEGLLTQLQDNWLH
jgi:hypothetical protein